MFVFFLRSALCIPFTLLYLTRSLLTGLCCPYLLFFAQIFSVVFKANLPHLYRKFRKMGLVPDCYLMEWCMTLFSKQLPLHVASRSTYAPLCNAMLMCSSLRSELLSLFPLLLLSFDRRVSLFFSNVLFFLWVAVWDGYFIHGETFVFQTAAALIKLLESEVRASSATALPLLALGRCFSLLVHVCRY